jgi:hypothetical protein
LGAAGRSVLDGIEDQVPHGGLPTDRYDSSRPLQNPPPTPSGGEATGIAIFTEPANVKLSMALVLAPCSLHFTTLPGRQNGRPTAGTRMKPMVKKQKSRK